MGKIEDHTPGPWQIEQSLSNVGPWCISRIKGQLPLAYVCGNDFAHNGGHPIRWDEATANARLIAAAPQMREALEEVDVGLQLWLESHGDIDGRIVGLKKLIRSALPTD